MPFSSFRALGHRCWNKPRTHGVHIDSLGAKSYGNCRVKPDRGLVRSALQNLSPTASILCARTKPVKTCCGNFRLKLSLA
jgi:hypothetical protein